MKSTNCKKCKDGKNNRGRWTNHPASQWWQTLQLFRSNKLRYHSLFRLYIHDYLEAKHCVFKHLFCLYNTAKHGQRAGRLLLLDTLFALSNREGHFAWSLIFPPCITGVFYFWDCSTCICIGVKITIQQLCSPWFKKKKKKIHCAMPRKSWHQDCLSKHQDSACNYNGGVGGWILCDRIQGVLLKKRKKRFHPR